MRVEALDLRFGLAPRASLGDVCENFPEVGVSRRGTANVVECLIADA